jgi:hypothetical protein
LQDPSQLPFLEWARAWTDYDLNFCDLFRGL